MAVKYYSDKTNKYYPTAEAAEKAELALKEQENRERIQRERAEREKKEREEKLATERKARAIEVEEARVAMEKARSKYANLLEAFCRDYKTFHLSLTGEDAKKAIPTLFDIFNPFIF